MGGKPKRGSVEVCKLVYKIAEEVASAVPQEKGVPETAWCLRGVSRAKPLPREGNGRAPGPEVFGPGLTLFNITNPCMARLSLV